MSAKELASRLKADIENLKQQGVAAIYADNLIAYLANIENSPASGPSPADIEHLKAFLNSDLEARKHSFSSQLEMFRSVIQAGQNAIRTIIWINGGASVAMLAFLGHLAAIRSQSIPTYAACLLPFVIGTFLGGLVSGGTYLSQWLFAGGPKANRAGFVINIAVIVVGILAFIAFLVGALSSYHAFVTVPPMIP